MAWHALHPAPSVIPHPTTASLDEVVAHFQHLQDPRSPINRRHPLPSILVIAILAVIAGAKGPTAIARWASLKADFLASFLDLPHGIPSKDVFRRLLMILPPDIFRNAFAAWVATSRGEAIARTGIEQPILNIDGKTARRSHDHAEGLKALHCVSVWAGEYGLRLGQLACDEKSDEITAIPEVLKIVDLRGGIVTIDAMGAQTAIAEAVIDKHGDYVFALKGNQPTLHEAVVEKIDEYLEGPHASQEEHVTTQKGHGREETRTYLQIAVPEGLAQADQWRGLKSIGLVTSHRRVEGKESSEVRYYVSSLEVDVKRFERAVRGHWSIENACHWCLDVTFEEDQSRVRQRQLRDNFAWLSKMALSLLKQHPGRQSVAMKRRSCGWSDKFLMEVITTSTC